MGLSVLSALHKLDHGEEGEADVEIGGRTLRIRFDPLKKRVLMFELKKDADPNPPPQRSGHKNPALKPAPPGNRARGCGYCDQAESLGLVSLSGP